MKNYFWLPALILLFQACEKEKAPDQVIIPEIPSQETQAPSTGTTVNNGSISYTTINQELAYNKFIALDVDNNGKNDFYFTSVLIYHGGQSHLYLLASPVSANGGKLLLDDTEELVMNGMWAKPLNAGTGISPVVSGNTVWSNYMVKGVVLDVIQDNSNLFNGPWVGKQDYYMAIQVLISGKAHYGWVRISHTVNEERIIISGFAYNTVAEEGINAGQSQ